MVFATNEIMEPSVAGLADKVHFWEVYFCGILWLLWSALSLELDPQRVPAVHLVPTPLRGQEQEQEQQKVDHPTAIRCDIPQ